MACGRRGALSRGGAIRALAPAMRANARIRLRGAPIARTGNTARFYLCCMTPKNGCLFDRAYFRIERKRGVGCGAAFCPQFRFERNGGAFCAQNIAAVIICPGDEVLLLGTYAFSVGFAKNIDVFARVCHNICLQNNIIAGVNLSDDADRSRNG